MTLRGACVRFGVAMFVLAGACGDDEAGTSREVTPSDADTVDARDAAEDDTGAADGARPSDAISDDTPSDDASSDGDAAPGDTTPTPDTPPTPIGEAIAPRFPSDVPEGFVLHDLGDHPTFDGETEDFTFDVPEGAVTLHVTLATTAGSTVALLGALSPEGEWIVFDDPPDGASRNDADDLASGFGGGLLSPVKSVALPRAVTTLIPNTPRVALTPGRWTFRAGSFDVAFDEREAAWVKTPVERDLRVGMLVRTLPIPAAGSIDLVLSFDPSSGLSAASAERDPQIVASLDILAAALAPIGIAIGELTLRDVALETTSVALLPPRCNLTDDVAKVFDEAPAPRPDVVHVVLLGRFTCPLYGGLYDFGDGLAALSIGAPGTPFSTRSGILVSTFAKATYPVEWSEVMAHEIGHYLGLFHTRETRGGIVDNIPDTAEDEVGAAANLMYFNVTLSTETTLTPEQGAVVRSSPLVRPTR